MHEVEGKIRTAAISAAAFGAVLGLCFAPLAARADDTDDADVKALVKPANTVEFGALDVSKGSTKFGEYNGLNKSGGYLLGNIDLRGGGYGTDNNALRWDIHGADLGTTSRSFGASVREQGRWNLGFDFDQLRHYTTDNYQTPYVGAMGGNVFTLPANFGVINSQSAPGTRTLTATQLGDFHTQDVYSQRKNTSFNAGYVFNDQWSVKFDFNRLDQSGAKLIGAGTDTFAGGPGGFNYRGEAIAILMTPTSYKTDTVRLGMNWLGEKAHLSASYDGSFFHDDFSGMSFAMPFVGNPTATGTLVPGGAYPMSTMSTPPSNQFHQWNLSGGYRFSSATRIAGGFSYGRNTQNQGYAGTYTTTPNTATGLPAASLNGLVVMSHADLKLTHQASRNLALSAGFKYNERDNRTAANTYTFLDLGGVSRTAVSTPMSNRRTQFELGGDYRITASQRLHAGYEYDKVSRWCNDSLSNNARGIGAAAATYYTTASCAQVPESKESKLALVYKLKASDAVDVNAAYSYGDRKSTVNSAFYNPMQSVAEGYETLGYRAFFQASRKEDVYKVGANWQAAERLNLGASTRYTKDAYDAALGVQRGQTATLNLDGTYSFSDSNTVSVFTTWQNRSRDLSTASVLGTGVNSVVPPTNFWNNKLTDKDNTFGVNARQKGLLKGKLELSEDLTYSLARSRYSTALVANIAPAVGNSGDTPDIRSSMTQFRLRATYAVDKASGVVLGYSHQRLRSNDYYYNAYQYGFTPTSLLPTNQQAPSYNVDLIYAAYRYTFQ